MEGINRYSGAAKQPSNGGTAAITGSRQKGGAAVLGGSGIRGEEAVILDSTAEQDWEKAVSNVMDALNSCGFPVKLEVSDLTSAKDLALYSASLGKGLHLVVSRDFIYGLAANPARLQQGKQALLRAFAELSIPPGGSGGVVADGDGGISIWQKEKEPPVLPGKTFSPSDQMNENAKAFNDALLGGESLVKHYKEKGGRSVTEIRTQDGVIRFVFTKRLNYSPAGHLLRLARLHSSGEVRSLIGGVQANIRRVKGDSNLDEDEIKQAVAKMEGVIRRARTKIKNLGEEGMMEISRRRAAEKQERKKEAEIALELKRRRTLRKAREYAQVRDRMEIPLLPGERKEGSVEWEEKILAAPALEGVVAAAVAMESLPGAVTGAPAGGAEGGITTAQVAAVDVTV